MAESRKRDKHIIETVCVSIIPVFEEKSQFTFYVFSGHFQVLKVGFSQTNKN